MELCNPSVCHAYRPYDCQIYICYFIVIFYCYQHIFVVFEGPPFVRPLAKTYGPAMRRCKHFMNLMKGEGFDDMSNGAKGSF